MRIRTIKPEFWRSDDVRRLPREVRLLFIGLWSYVDDNGVGVDDYRQIAAELGAIEDDPIEFRDYVREGLATLSRSSSDISSVPVVVRYEVAGKRYLFITAWDKHQRVDKPGKPRYPRPPEALTGGHTDCLQGFEDASRDTRETLAPGTEEQGNRGIQTKTSSSSVPRKRGTRIPDDFTVTTEMVTWARDRVPHVDGRLETEKFVNYWRAATGQKATKCDWEATWRNWMLNAAERTQQIRRPAAPATKPSTTDQRVAAVLALARPNPPAQPHPFEQPGAAS